MVLDDHFQSQTLVIHPNRPGHDGAHIAGRRQHPEGFFGDWRLVELDPSDRSRVVRRALHPNDLFDALRSPQRALVMVTHDSALAGRAQRVVALRNGKLEYDGDPAHCPDGLLHA